MGALAAGILGGTQLLGGLLGQESQESMRASAYQTATADMRKAGLNPALMYGSGGPAQSFASPIPGAVGGAVSSAMEAARVGAEVKLLGAQASAADAAAFKAHYDGLSAAQGLKLYATDPKDDTLEQRRYRLALQLLDAQAFSARSIGQLNRAGLPGAEVRGSRPAAFADLIMRGISSAAGSARQLYGGFNPPIQ